MADGEAERVAQKCGHPVPGTLSLVARHGIVHGFHPAELFSEVPGRVELRRVHAAAQQVVALIGLNLCDQSLLQMWSRRAPAGSRAAGSVLIP
ncbi:MAG TPA: hypothetical protein VFP27_19380 [Mycobacterium sp.]|nr:hypothetical protein [Mycobacterium sp.]